MSLAQPADIEVDFELSERVYQLDGVEVSSSNKAWKRNLKRFKQLAFSTTKHARHCTILQPELLSLRYDEATEELVALSEEPFVFENKALGYVVAIHNFRMTGTPAGYKWEGNAQFTEMADPNGEKTATWRKSRAKVYQGSPRHFFQTLISGTTRDEGFMVTAVSRLGVQPEGLMGDPLDRLFRVSQVDERFWRIDFSEILAVVFRKESEPASYARYQVNRGLVPVGAKANRGPYQYSWLISNRSTLLVDQYGNEYGDFSAVRYGYWEWERLCDVLPLDYVPNP